ncbi:synaptic vesicular amine transporter-like [Coccinella septempunctata]|uniref:synaptic vesicular amine transporter-like n=1 Tax=Coccinella septempunctata TaxID=41139 RepID=UPI001D089398|nr:synaptic vesicular amine transporter-like [Coccinella septempunctata]
MQPHAENSTLILFVVVYLSFFLDNVLLTVVVPIIPDYLFSNDIKSKENTTTFHGLTSLSPLQRKYEGLDNENGVLGALLASKAFVQLLFTPFVGYAVTKVGSFLPMLLGSCNILLASLLFAYGKSYGSLVLARALHGSSSAAVSVSGMSLLAKHVPVELRPKLMPVAFGGIALGVLLGYPFGGVAYQGLGKQAPFIFISLVISLNIGLQLNLMSRNDSEETPDETESLPETLGVTDLLRDKKILISTGAICISTTTMAVLEPCVPLWLMRHFDPPPPRWVLGAVFIPDSIGYFLGSHFGGLLPMESWRVSLAAMLIGGLSSYGLSLANSIPQLFLPHFGIGLSVGVVDAILVPYLATVIESRGSTKYGPVYTLQQVAVSLAYSFGPLLGGEAVNLIGFSWLMKIIGLLNVIFCPLMVELEDGSNDRKVRCMDSSTQKGRNKFNIFRKVWFF